MAIFQNTSLQSSLSQFQTYFYRFLFWLSGGMTRSIQRSDVTGEMKTTLIKIAEQLKALSIDRQDKRLFWVQVGLQGESAIASCDYNGNALHILDQPVRWACCIPISHPSFYFCYWVFYSPILWSLNSVQTNISVGVKDANIKALWLLLLMFYCFVLFLLGLSHWGYQFFWSTYTTLMLHLGL